MRNLLAVAVLIGLSACGPANAVPVDAKNNIHCSVLAFYFHGLAKHDGAPNKQIHAMKGLQDWYAIKMRSDVGGRYFDPAVMQSEVGPILATIKADPFSMRDEVVACADRAAADPAFNDFSRSYMLP